MTAEMKNPLLEHPEDQPAELKAQTLIEALPYIQKYYGKTISCHATNSVNSNRYYTRKSLLLFQSI